MQREFLEDPHRFKVACSGRRAGKSFAIAAYCIIECLRAANTPCLYLGLTRDSAKEAVWSTLLGMLEGLDIPHEARPSALQIKFPNGSVITLFGGDTPNARNRLRGRKFRLVCADETGFFVDLDPIMHALLPTLADLRGSLIMASSPGIVLSGFFYDAYQGANKASWHQWHWNMRTNPHFMKPAIDPAFETAADEELDIIARLQFGGNRKHPAFEREYLGIYRKDDTRLVYPYQDHNLIDRPSNLPRKMYAIGIDLGVSSACAIACLQFSQYSRQVEIVETWSKAEVLVDDLAAKIRYYQDKYDPIMMVADTGGMGAAFVQELRKRYQLPIKPADKMQKQAYQSLFANDLISSYIKVVKGLNILTEYDKLLRDADGDEIRGPDNHEADAALYVYRYVYNTYLKTFQPEETLEAKIERQAVESALAERDEREENEEPDGF